MMNTFRQRKTDYPRTYFLFQEKGKFYLLFWLEHGKDDSLYIWFDDDPNKSWKLVAKYHQDKLFGTASITLKHNSYKIFDPHISWHPSGKIHVTGYDEKGGKKERVLSDKESDPLYAMVGGVTVPITQIVLPTINLKNSLKFLGDDLSKVKESDSWFGILDKRGFNVMNNSAPGEGFFIVDSSIIPSKHNLGFDVCACWKTNTPNYEGKSLGDSILTSDIFKINRGATGITACLRLFSLPFEDKPRNLQHIVAACFNKESTDLFQLKKLF